MEEKLDEITNTIVAVEDKHWCYDAFNDEWYEVDDYKVIADAMEKLYPKLGKAILFNKNIWCEECLYCGKPQDNNDNIGPCPNWLLCEPAPIMGNNYPNCVICDVDCEQIPTCPNGAAHTYGCYYNARFYRRHRLEQSQLDRFLIEILLSRNAHRSTCVRYSRDFVPMANGKITANGFKLYDVGDHSIIRYQQYPTGVVPDDEAKRLFDIIVDKEIIATMARHDGTHAYRQVVTVAGNINDIHPLVQILSRMFPEMKRVKYGIYYNMTNSRRSLFLRFGKSDIKLPKLEALDKKMIEQMIVLLCEKIRVRIIV